MIINVMLRLINSNLLIVETFYTGNKSFVYGLVFLLIFLLFVM
ncbi:hypothetical protein SDC9_51759 [bioreactor metagenome]|uniref:Uncharacterized protein n=1 Tax=bioreactor metagenome TaxID=1076179 RepID=A0A644WP64_9ZZZZ